MTAPATGLFKSVAYGAETTFGTAALTGSGQLLRRTQSTLSLAKANFKSNEIIPDRQLRDMRLGTRSVKGNIQGELSPGTYKDFFAALLAGTFTAGVTSSAQTDVTAAAGTPGTFTTAGAFNWLTKGFKVGNTVRATGFTAGGAANNSKNFRVTGVTATVLTVAEPVAAKAAGDSVTFSVVGKTLVTPTSGLTDPSFSLEHWHSDVGQSELFLGCKPSQVALNLPANALATANFTFMGQDMTTATAQYFTSPAAVSSSNLTAGVNGKLSVGGTDFATITGLSLTINGNHTTEPVVGSVHTPGVFPGILDVTGQATVLFDTASAALRDDFLNESEVDLLAYLTLSNAVNSDFISFHMPRIKFITGDKDDKPGAITQTLQFQALNNVSGGTGTSTDACTISIQDSLA